MKKILISIMLVISILVNTVTTFASDSLNIKLSGFDDSNVLYIKEGDTSQTGTPILINGVEFFTEDEAKEIVSSIKLINNSEDILTLSEVKYSVWNGEYFVTFRKQLKSAELGTEATFTLKYKDFEQTYTVKVVDYDLEVEKILETIQGSNGWVENPIEDDGTIQLEYALSADSFAFSYQFVIGLMNYNSRPLSIKNIDLEKLYIDTEEGMQRFNPSTTIVDGVPVGGDSIEDIKDDTIVLYNFYAGSASSYPYMKIKPVREGDVYFTVHYGDVSQRFHIIADNTYSKLPGDIILDKKEVYIEPNETVDFNSTISPSDAKYIKSLWEIVVPEGISNEADAYTMIEDSGDSAKIKFLVEGEYLVYRKLYVSDDYNTEPFISNVCRVVVDKDEVVTPKPTDTPEPTSSPSPTETIEPTNTPKPSETIAPTGTPVPSETIKPTPSETIKPSETVSPTPTETVSPKPSETIEPTGTPTIEPTNTPSRVYRLGDVDINDSVTARDALAILKHSAKIEDLEGISLQLADLDGDGIINSRDALSVLKISAKIEDERFVEL